MSTNAQPLPIASPWSAPYWEAAKKREFVIQSCSDCDKPIMYPRRYCPHCLQENLSFVSSPGTGEIYTLTTQTAGPPSGFSDQLPYVIAVIKLDEGVQLMSNIVGPGAQEAKIGDRVKVDFRQVDGSDTVLPVFVLEQA